MCGPLQYMTNVQNCLKIMCLHIFVHKAKNSRFPANELGFQIVHLRRKFSSTFNPFWCTIPLRPQNHVLACHVIIEL